MPFPELPSGSDIEEESVKRRPKKVVNSEKRKKSDEKAKMKINFIESDLKEIKRREKNLEPDLRDILEKYFSEII